MTTRRALVLWIAGLFTLVPGASWWLYVHAEREQDALLITLVLFWVFGYWGLVGPLVALNRVRRVLAALGEVRSREDLLALLQSSETRAAAIDLLAAEHRLPRPLAARVLRLLERRVPAGLVTGGASPLLSGGRSRADEVA